MTGISKIKLDNLNEHWCKCAMLLISSSSHKNNMPKVSHYQTFTFWDIRTQDIWMFVYKHTETIKYVKK